MNWVDTSLLIYGFFPDHPARTVVRRELEQSDWGSTVHVLSETYHVLVRDYRVTPNEAASSVSRLAQSGMQWIQVSAEQAVAAASLSASHRLQSADAMLLLLAQGDRGTLVTPDQRLLRVGQALGVAVRNPTPPSIAAEIHEWEAEHLPQKGLARTLDLVERWIRQRNWKLADQFVEPTSQLRALRL